MRQPLPRIAVIGGGPSGAAAALQLRRYGFDPVIFERARIGGLALNASRIENYLGFPRGITGAMLAGLISRQLRQHGVKITNEEVTALDYVRDSFVLGTGRHDPLIFDLVVAASGTKPRHISDGICGKDCERIEYEAFPLRKVSGKIIAVLGAGDAAFDYALSLQKRNEVFILSRTTRAKCLSVLWQRAMQCRRITFIGGVDIMRIDFTKHHLSIKLRKFHDIIKADHVLAAYGRTPNNAYMKPGLLAMKQQLVRKKKLFVIGDLKNGRYRQVSIAAGEGLRTAMEIYEHCKGTRNDPCA